MSTYLYFKNWTRIFHIIIYFRTLKYLLFIFFVILCYYSNFIISSRICKKKKNSTQSFNHYISKLSTLLRHVLNLINIYQIAYLCILYHFVYTHYNNIWFNLSKFNLFTWEPSATALVVFCILFDFIRVKVKWNKIHHCII